LLVAEAHKGNEFKEWGAWKLEEQEEHGRVLAWWTLVKCFLHSVATSDCLVTFDALSLAILRKHIVLLRRRNLLLLQIEDLCYLVVILRNAVWFWGEIYCYTRRSCLLQDCAIWFVILRNALLCFWGEICCSTDCLLEDRAMGFAISRNALWFWGEFCCYCRLVYCKLCHLVCNPEQELVKWDKIWQKRDRLRDRASSL
jgi:hypothetical protein